MGTKVSRKKQPSDKEDAATTALSKKNRHIRPKRQPQKEYPLPTKLATAILKLTMHPDDYEKWEKQVLARIEKNSWRDKKAPK